MPPDLPERIDRYRILHLLGRGSMGDVFLAVDPKFDRKMALKVMSTHRLGDDAEDLEDLRQRFVNEALAAGRLNHPGIVTVYDADTDTHTGWPFIAMEWVDGLSLRAHLKSQGPLPIDSAVALARDVAIALDYAHGQGVVHRDIKPANLLLRSDGRVKVADFGVAKLVSSSLTLTGQVLGSPNYMAPEQVRAEPVDGRTDLFALGVVLYECLAGRPAFAADSLAGITFKIVSVDPRPVEIYNPNVPPNLGAVLRRMLEKESADRFQTGEELAETLGAIGRELEEASTGVRSPTRELTLPAGVPERALPPRSADGTRIAPAPAATSAAAAQAEAANAEAHGAPEKAKRRSWTSRLAMVLVMVLALLFGVRWLAEPSRTDLAELTSRLGIFDARLTSEDAPDDTPASPLADSPIEDGDTARADIEEREPANPESLAGLVDAGPDQPQHNGTGPDGTELGGFQQNGTGPDGLDAPGDGGERGTPRNTEGTSDEDATAPSEREPAASASADEESSETAGEAVAGEAPDGAADTPPLRDATGDQSSPAAGPSDSEGADASEGEGEPAVPQPRPALETPPPPPPPPPPRPETTRFRVVLDNHLKLGYLAVFIDGKRVMTRRIEAEGLMSRWMGEMYHFEVPVAVGKHRVEVHVSGLSPRVEAPGRIEGEFVRGEVPVLEVDVDRRRKKSNLTWRNKDDGR